MSVATFSMLAFVIAGGLVSAGAAAASAPRAVSPHAAPSLRFPNRWAYYTAVLSCPRGRAEHFTTCWSDVGQCLRGYRRNGMLIGEITNAERTVVIAHLNCGGSVCYNLDTGNAFYDGRHVAQLDLKNDMTATDVEAARASCAVAGGGR